MIIPLSLPMCVDRGEPVVQASCRKFSLERVPGVFWLVAWEQGGSPSRPSLLFKTNKSPTAH